MACLVALTSVAVGVSRGQADPAGTYVLCTGHGAVTVHVDARGNPTGMPTVCPDCVLAFLFTVEDRGTMQAASPVQRHPYTFPRNDQPHSASLLRACARAPPVSV